jgi:hypothetical protein
VNDSFMWILIAALVALMGLGIAGSIREERRWQEFSRTHDCKVIGHIAPSYGTGVGPAIGGNGGVAVTTVTIPGKTGYRCNDGLEYWR